MYKELLSRQDLALIQDTLHREVLRTSDSIQNHHRKEQLKGLRNRIQHELLKD